jgi:hypothetical protein
LAEFADHSIGVFVHRGDSPGEGGSNVYFLANKRCDHQPLSNLYDKLSDKLADQALIVSDGSNVDRGFLKQVQAKNVSGVEAYDALRDQNFTFGEFGWRCVGYMGSCRGFSRPVPPDL